MDGLHSGSRHALRDVPGAAFDDDGSIVRSDRGKERRESWLRKAGSAWSDSAAASVPAGSLSPL